MARVASAASRALALGLVVAAALALRLVGLGHELPQRTDEDPLIVTQAENLRRALSGDPAAPGVDPHYPLVLAGTLALWPPPAHDAARERAQPLEYHLERASGGHRRARFLVAVLSTLAVPFTWLLARRFLEAPWALFAAGLVATSLLHLQLSQAARPHGVLASWIALGLWLDLRLLERGRWREHLAAGAAAALALGTLHTGASALLPLGAAQFLALRRDGRSVLPRILTAWALVALAASLAYSWPIRHGATAALSESEGLLNLSGHLFPSSAFDGGGFARMLPLLAATDPVLLALALGGLAIALASWARRRAGPDTAVAILCAWAVPYLLVMGLYGRLPTRFLLPLLPLLALLAAFALQRLAKTLRRRERARAIPALAAALVLAVPTYASLRLAWLRARPDASEEVALWLVEHADRERDLLYLSAWGNLPLFTREESGGELFAATFMPWDNYQSHLPPDLVAEHAWRTRRLIARDPQTGQRRLDRDGLLGVLREPTHEPARKRFAVVAFDDAMGTSDHACEAVLAAGGRALWTVPVLAGDLGAAERGPLRTRPPGTLATLLRTRRLGFSTVVYELPAPASAPSNSGD
jgi:hypothetical protein